MSAAANLLTLRDFTLISTWRRAKRSSTNGWRVADYYRRSDPLQLRKSTESDEAGGWDRWTGDEARRKFECFKRQCRQPAIPYEVGYLKGTFSETLLRDRKKIFLASYLFAYNLGLVKEMVRTLEVDKKSIVLWTQWFRDVLLDYYTTNVTRIGEPNIEVQVDKTHIVRGKYNVGRIVRRDWLVGGIEDETKLVFVEVTDNRSAANLDAIIQRHVVPRSVISTDIWRGYNNLTNLGYIHETSTTPQTSCIRSRKCMRNA